MRISDWSSDVCSSDLMTEFLRIARNPLLQHVGGERGDRHTRPWQDTEDRANTGPAQDGAAGIPHLLAVGHQAFDADGLDVLCLALAQLRDDFGDGNPSHGNNHEIHAISHVGYADSKT